MSSDMRAASQSHGRDPLISMTPIRLHINQRSDYVMIYLNGWVNTPEMGAQNSASI